MSREGRPGRSVLTSLMVYADAKQYCSRIGLSLSLICQPTSEDIKQHRKKTKTLKQSSGAVLKSRWPSWALRPNELYGFRGRKAILNHAHALVSACT